MYRYKSWPLVLFSILSLFIMITTFRIQTVVTIDDGSRGLVIREVTDENGVPEYCIVESIGKCKDADIVIPSYYKGLPVTQIIHNAFQNSSIRSVTIPSTVKVIGDSSFAGCEELTAVYLSEGLATITDNAFAECHQLQEIALPKSLRSIGYQAFYRCTELNTLDIEDGVESIGDYAFAYCASLRSISLPDSIATLGYGAFEGCESLKNARLPVTANIPERFFYECTKLEKVTMPELLNTIGTEAFYRCESLTALTITADLFYIDKDAFSMCNALSYIEYGGTMKMWEELCMQYGDYPVRNCTVHCSDGDYWMYP